jgi:hypothetical protein
MATTEFMITTAYRLASATRQGEIISGPEYEQAFGILNLILANWSAQNIYIFYTGILETQLTPGLTAYRIGNDSAYEVQSNPYVQIDYITYTVGNITYSPIKLTPTEFDSIAFKPISTYPGYWAYEIFKDYTILKFFPQPTGSELFNIRGKKRLNSFVEFEENTDIPDYAVLPLAYELANHLQIIAPSQPQQDFQKNLAYQRQLMIDSNQIDLEIKQEPAFRTWKDTSRLTGNNGGLY